MLNGPNLNLLGAAKAPPQGVRLQEARDKEGAIVLNAAANTPRSPAIFDAAANPIPITVIEPLLSTPATRELFRHASLGGKAAKARSHLPASAASAAVANESKGA